MRSLLDLLYPPRCLHCGKILENRTVLCEDCRKSAAWCRKVKTKPQFLDSVTAVWYYKENVRESLLRFKFRGGSGQAAAYGRFLAAAVRRDHPEGFDCLTWVPTASRRRFRRGYDQAKLICKALGKELSMKPEPLLRKIRSNRAQSSLGDPAQRRANVLGVYRFRGKKTLEGRRVLLVDDIFTTGATAGECARVLKSAGAKTVCCAVVASAERD